MADKKMTKGCLLAVIVTAALAGIIAIGFIFCGLLSLIAAPTLLNAADKAKEGAVKANTSAAMSTITTYAIVDNLPPEKAISEVIKNLNECGTPDDPSDDAYSPFDPNISAFSTTPAPGVVTISYDSKNNLYIFNGYDKEGNVFTNRTLKPLK